MPLLFQHHIQRADLRRNPTALYVFGDNLQLTGKLGQALEMRGEPNAVGLPTKRFPSRQPHAYLLDQDFDFIIQACAPHINKLRAHLSQHGIVVWPVDGIGTGLAQLFIRAPRIQQYYDELLESFKKFNPKSSLDEGDDF